MSKFAAIILAAGKGKRMKSDRPKVMHEIAGRPMVNYVIDTVSELKPAHIVTVVAPGMDVVKSAVLSENPKVKFAVQKQQKGTGDAVKAALPALKGFKGNILVLYGDTPFISKKTLNNMLDLLDSSEKPAVAVLGFMPQDPAEYGRLMVNSRNELEAIVEFKDASPQERMVRLCNSGVMGIRGDLLLGFLDELKNDNAKGEFYLTDIVEIARKKEFICLTLKAGEEEVMGINSRDQLAAAEAAVQMRLRSAAMEFGATLIAPETVFFSFDARIGKDVTIHPYVVIGRDTEIGDEVEIRSFSHIEGARINKGAKIGPFARLRPGADIGEDVKIGNFVEIKKSKIGKGSAVSHLSYIGDTVAGEGVNVGAGTITCNYDGKKKYQTSIGKGAFIGSNSSLVAPVKIGEGAVIGAGATIIKDVKKGAKVINDMPQKELK